MKRFVDRLIDQVINWWLIDWSNDWLIDWWIDWFVHWLIGWSIDWLNTLYYITTICIARKFGMAGIWRNDLKVTNVAFCLTWLRLRVVPTREKARVGWFSRALAFRSLYYPWGKMGTTRSLHVTQISLRRPVKLIFYIYCLLILLCLADLDHEQPLFLISPSSKTRETRKWPRTWLKARDGRGRPLARALACTPLTKSEEKERLFAVYCDLLFTANFDFSLLDSWCHQKISIMRLFYKLSKQI